MRKQNYWGYIFTLPYSIHVVVFIAFPIMFSAYLSFAQWDLFNPPKWVGLTNWTFLMKQREFWFSVRNVLYMAIISVPLQTFLALIIAHLLNQSIRGKTIFRLFYFLPVVTPWIAGGIVWAWLFNTKYGLINWALSGLQMGPVAWLDSKQWWVVLGSIALVSVWKGIGTSMILLLAGMQNISKEMNEASQIDGASGWRYFSSIVFPLVSPMIFLVMILASIASFQAFDVFFAVFGNNVTSFPDRILVPNMLIYRDAFMLSKMGSASVTAWALFIIIMAITLFQKYFEKRWVHYD